MIAVDTNILVYAHRAESVWNTAARSCLERLAADATRWMIPGACLHEFLAVVTHPQIYNPASTIDEAFEQIDIWKESPSLLVEVEGAGHLSVLRDLMTRGRISGPLVYDAHIAAICLECGVEELWSCDRDFLRFPQLKVVNPLVSC